MNKKKLHFWQLAFIFGSLSLLSLMGIWGYNRGVETSSGMMGNSMGAMMRSMHGRNITVQDLIRQEENTEVLTGSNAHHQSNDENLQTVHYLTTGTIIILIPFIVAGSIFLWIIWLK